MPNKVESFGKASGREFQTSKDNEILELEFLREHDGEIVRRTYGVGKPSKTLQQLRFLRGVGFPKLAEFLGYGDVMDLILYFKEMHMIKFREIKSPHTGKIQRLKYYESFADVDKDRTSELIEHFLDWCNELSFPMRELYREYIGKAA